METSESNQLKQIENKSAVVVNSTIFKLVEAIEKKIKPGDAGKGVEELQILRDQCGSDNPLISVTACQGLVYLVKSFVCPLPNTISALVASLFSVKSVTGATSALTELLILELKCVLATDTEYSCPYNTKNPQHPLVAVLKIRPIAWSDVLNQVAAVCTHPDKQVTHNSLELVKPVLLYVLMESNELPSICRLQAFRIIINYFPQSNFLIEMLAACMCWPDSRVLEAVQVIELLAQTAQSSRHGLHVSLCCLALVGVVPRLLQAGHSPQPTLCLLSALSSTAGHTHSTLLAALADTIPACPSIYLDHLLSFLLELLGQGQCSLDTTWMCVSGLLPWLTSRSGLLHKALHTATLIVSHANAATANPSTTVKLITNSAVALLVSADPRLSQALHIARLSEELRGDSSATLRWLENNKQVNMDPVHLFISALLSRGEPEVRLAALPALVSSQAPVAPSLNLTLLLYHLAREREPANQLAILRALLSTATDKSNVMGVISTLEALRRSGSQNLSLLAVDLYCELWVYQERCFPQLMDVLNRDCSEYKEVSLGYLLQANICKKICMTKPEMHGKEVVAKVSDLLNRCGGVKDSAAAALAIDALIPLCQHDVVDVFTIWRSLAPRFTRDKRPPVLKSMCQLVSVAAKQKSTTSDSDDILKQIIRWLWNLVATNKHPSVVEHALNVLSKFRLDQMTLKMLPECFRMGIKLPPEYAKTPVDAARKPEDVLDYIPGECWIQVLRHVGTEAASLAIANWIKVEVASFHVGSLYQVDRQEPVSYSHLPVRSVVRGVTTSLQQLCQASDTDCVAVDLCLIAMSQPTPRPLPSLSWAFLHNLTDPSPSVTLNVMRLAAKQCQISPTARKITDKFIADCGNDKDKIRFLYSLLRDLCRGIPPNTLRPFIERTLQSSLNEKDNEQLRTLFGHVKVALKEEKIHEANRVLLHQQIKALWDLFEPQHEVLSEYFACVAELPVAVLESMTTMSLQWEVTPTQLQRAFRLRAFMALLPQTEQPLNWINEIIEAGSANISEQALAEQLITNVMSQLGKHPSAWSWLQELMGQTHMTSANNKGGVEFLVTVFMLCVDIMSGYYSLSISSQDTRPLRFPQAVTSLVRQYGDTKAMMEWLNHMKTFDSFPSQFAPPFEMAARNVSLILS